MQELARAMLPFRRRGDSIIHSYYNYQLGPVGSFSQHSYQTPLRNCLKYRFVEEACMWSVSRTLSPFNRRVTAVEWHPTYHNVVAFASHGGGIYLWSFEDSSKDLVIQGMGYGYGCITAMKFHPENPNTVYTASVDGQFCLKDFNGRHSSIYLNTQDLTYWWCSVDCCRAYNVVFVGGNTGKAVILDSDGTVVCRYRKLHKSKIKHAEFCPTKSWLLVTASVDRTVALWDIRMLKSKTGDVNQRPTPLSVFEHKAPVNSVTFDPHYGTQILTTAQNSELRVYDTYSNCEKPTVIVTHPHRHFQHMTDVAATWHPLYEGLCVVGRYPEKEDADQKRSIDLVDMACGERVGSIHSPSLKGIIPLNKFNKLGTFLASGMGYHCLLWQPAQETLEKARERVREEQADRQLSLSLSSQPLGSGTQQTRNKKRKRNGSEDTAKKKLKTKKAGELYILVMEQKGCGTHNRH